MPTPFSPSRQIAFHQLLVGARKKWLSDALAEALLEADPEAVKAQLLIYLPKDIQKMLAAAGIRDEQVFPVPAVLEARPTLVGYYRLLLGVSQKSFYRTGSGMRPFRSMEMSGTLKAAQKDKLGEFCEAMSASLAELARQLSPAVTGRDIHELPLITLGAQFQGGNNVTIGKQATIDVFLAIEDIVKGQIVERTDKRIVVMNASRRKS